MPNLRLPKTLDSAGIDRERYQELIHFSRQYCKKKEKVKDFYSVSATKISGLPCAHSNNSSVEMAVEKILNIQEDIDIIESCVKEACAHVPGMYPYILKSVTEGDTYERMPVPCTRRIFYEYRRCYFLLLNERKK